MNSRAMPTPLAKTLLQKLPLQIFLTLTLTLLASLSHALTSGSSEEGSITEKGEEQSYSFEANTGDSIVLSIGSEVTILMTLRSPSGVELNLDTDRITQNSLVESGTYSVTVYGRFHTLTGGYELHFVKAPGPTEHQVVNSGGSHTGHINAGGIESFSIEASAGDSVQLSAGGDLDMLMAIYNPDGSRLAPASGNAFADSRLILENLPQTGTYTVVLVGRFTTFSGNYGFHFVKAPGDTEYPKLAGGVQYSHSITEGDLDSFTFNGYVGDTIKVLTSGEVSTTAFLYAPDGTQLSLRGDGSPHIGALQKEGIYTVIVRGRFVTFSGNYLLSYHSSRELMQVTQAVFHEGDGPIKLVYKRKTALILDKAIAGSTNLKPVVMEGVNPIFEEGDWSEDDIQNDTDQKIFYCRRENNYCNLEKDNIYSISYGDVTVAEVEVKEVNVLDIVYFPVVESTCTDYESCFPTQADLDLLVDRDEMVIQAMFPVADDGLLFTRGEGYIKAEGPTSRDFLLDVFNLHGFKWDRSLYEQKDGGKLETKRKNFSRGKLNISRAVGYTYGGYLDERGRWGAKGANPRHEDSETGEVIKIHKIVWSDADALPVWNNTAHEIGHTFNLPKSRNSQGDFEEYLKSGFTNQTTDYITIKDGFDVYGDYQRRHNRSQFVGPSYNFMASVNAGLSGQIWVRKDTWDELFEAVSSPLVDPPLINLNFIFNLNTHNVTPLRWGLYDGIEPTSGKGQGRIRLKSFSNQIIAEYDFPTSPIVTPGSSINAPQESILVSREISFSSELKTVEIYDHDGILQYQTNVDTKLFSSLLSEIIVQCGIDADQVDNEYRPLMVDLYSQIPTGQIQNTLITDLQNLIQSIENQKDQLSCDYTISLYNSIDEVLVYLNALELRLKNNYNLTDMPIPVLDSDGDGMPDGWETLYGLDSNNPSDGSEDSDGDGITNLQEFHNGTVPRISDIDEAIESEDIPLPFWAMAVLVTLLGGLGFRFSSKK